MFDYCEEVLELECVCKGLGFPEGPIAMNDGSVLVTEIRAKRLSRVAPDGTVSLVAETGGGPNGAAIGPDGAVYLCNNGGMAFVDFPDLPSVPVGAAADHKGGSIQRVDLATGVVTTLFTHCDDQQLNSPNDLVFDSKGGFWFTDLGRTLPGSSDEGYVYYARADGSHIQLVRKGMHGPNGIGLSPNGDVLYVAETVTGRLWCHDIAGPGTIIDTGNIWAPGRIFGPLPGYRLFDSLAVQADGAICVATLISGGITIWEPDGSRATFVPVPDFATTNICFGGDNLQTAWITASNSGCLYKARWPRPGLPLAYTA